MYNRLSKNQLLKKNVKNSSVMTRRYFSDKIAEEKRYPRALKTKQFGSDILHDPLFNKGTAFTDAERQRLGLRGLLPPVIKTIDEQAARVKSQMDALNDNVEKNMYLQELHNRNETLYFRTLVDDIVSMAPLVYTPTVGLVCQKFGAQYRRSRGMYFSKDDKGDIGSIIHNWPQRDVHVIVVTDGSRILGLGDLGVNGMGIPIGKLALYCAAGGIAPHRVMPVQLDVGTNNPDLINDPEYLGIKEPRLEGDAYYEFLDEFIQACFDRWPNAIVQFEDFETKKAVPLLERYRYKYRVFNDDMQGTGSVTLSCVLSALRNSGSDIKDMKVVCAGAGSAGIGVCEILIQGMMMSGMTREEAKSRFILAGSRGAVGSFKGGESRNYNADGSVKNPLLSDWCSSHVPDETPLEEIVKEFKPNVLLGLSTVGGVFTESIVKEMAKHHDRPIIMPMSNPTHLAECTPAQAYEWTNNTAIVATGSPFQPVNVSPTQTFIPSQCNNMYIFPGIGLAASISGVSIITDKMLYVAAAACTNTMTDAEREEGRTFPDIRRIREVSKQVAVAVIQEGLDAGLVTKLSKKDMAEGLESLVEKKMYYPDYVPIRSTYGH